jgi:hypothetical protein
MIRFGRALGYTIGWVMVCLMIPPLVVGLWVWEWWGRLRGKTWDR